MGRKTPPPECLNVNFFARVDFSCQTLRKNKKIALSADVTQNFSANQETSCTGAARHAPDI
jgi:hypothetical protein